MSLRTRACCEVGQPGPGAAQGQVQVVVPGADSFCNGHCSTQDWRVPAVELGSEQDGQGRGSCGSRGGRWPCVPTTLPTSRGCCRWLPSASPCPRGWLLTPQPHASSPEHPAPGVHHCSGRSLEYGVPCRSGGPRDSPTSPMPWRWLCWAALCSATPLAPRSISFSWEHGENIRMAGEGITCVGPFPLSS